jgi:hypothetical protein
VSKELFINKTYFHWNFGEMAWIKTFGRWKDKYNGMLGRTNKLFGVSPGD